MAENVQTGGVMQFKYEKGHQSRLSEKERKEIAEAYERAAERKRRERRRKIIGWGIAVLLILLGVGYVLLR